MWWFCYKCFFFSKLKWKKLSFRNCGTAVRIALWHFISGIALNYLISSFYPVWMAVPKAWWWMKNKRINEKNGQLNQIKTQSRTRWDVHFAKFCSKLCCRATRKKIYSSMVSKSMLQTIAEIKIILVLNWIFHFSECRWFDICLNSFPDGITSDCWANIT